MENNNSNIQNNDSYSKKSNKVIDFLIGYLGSLIIISILYFFSYLLGSTSPTAFSVGISWTISILTPIIILLFANMVLKKSRRYVAKGINFAILTLILAPILFFGACLIVLQGF